MRGMVATSSLSDALSVTGCSDTVADAVSVTVSSSQKALTRMFLARRELRFAWGRFALMGTVITLVAVLTVMLSGLATGLVDDGISGLRALPVSHLAFQAHTDSTFSRSTIDVATIAAR